MGGRGREAEGSRSSGTPSGAHLIERGTAELPEAPDNISIIGCDAANGTYFQLYSDERGVCRVYEMSIGDGEWKLWREGEPFSQRFTASFSDDGNTITGRWEIAEDGADYQDGLRSRLPEGRHLTAAWDGSSTLVLSHRPRTEPNESPARRTGKGKGTLLPRRGRRLRGGTSSGARCPACDRSPRGLGSTSPLASMPGYRKDQQRKRFTALLPVKFVSPGYVAMILQRPGLARVSVDP